MIDNKVIEVAAEKLREKIKSFQCPLCHKGPFTILKGINPVSLQTDLNVFDVTSSSAPCFVIMCQNCGYMSLHNALVIGFTKAELGLENKAND